MTRILSLRNLSCFVGSEAVLKDLSLELERGECVALLGPNGAGKSTLLKSVVGIVKPSQSSVYIDGVERSACSPRELARKIAWVPQTFAPVFPHRVVEFVGMGRYPHLGWMNSGTHRDQGVVKAALELCGIQHLAGRTLTALSGGELQLVLIASALAQEAELLLLDEPTTWLDPSFQNRVLQVLARLRRERRMALLIATHEINLAAVFCERVVAIKQGKICFDGICGDFLIPARLQELYDKEFDLITHPARDIRIVIPDLPEIS